VRARQRRIRLVLLAVVAMAAIGVPALLQSLGALDRLELSTIDARLSVRGNRRPNPNVVFVGIDSATLSAFGQKVPRSVEARAIDRLRRYGAKVIAYDVRFLGRQRPHAGDRALIAAVSRARPVVLATFDPDGKPIPVPAAYPHPGRIGVVYASIGVPTDEDGKVRRMLYAPVQIPTLPVQAAGLFLGHPVPESKFKDNSAWVDFPGPPGTVPTYSLVDVVRGRVAAAGDPPLCAAGPRGRARRARAIPRGRAARLQLWPDRACHRAAARTRHRRGRCADRPLRAGHARAPPPALALPPLRAGAGGERGDRARRRRPAAGRRAA